MAAAAVDIPKNMEAIVCPMTSSTYYPKVNPLLEAVAAGDEALVERIMMESGADGSMMAISGGSEGTLCPTPLHRACFDGRLDLVQLLLSSHPVTDYDGSDIDPVNCRGQTPLLLAVQSGNIDLVSYLIDLGSNANRSDYNDNNALHLAAASRITHRRTKSLQYVVEPVSQFSRSATVDKEQRDMIDMIDLLVSRGVNARQRNRYGLTPVRLAALVGSDECARRMLKRIFVDTRQSKSELVGVLPPEVTNERVRSRDQIETITLAECHRDRRRQLVTSLRRLIVSRTADSGTTDARLDTTAALWRPRHHSASLSFDRPSSLLGVTPLYAACTAGDHDTARLLLDICHADPDSTGSDTPSTAIVPCRGRRVIGLPLGVTILRNDVTLARLLLVRGASTCCGCLEESSPVHRRRQEEPCREFSADDCDLLELALYTDWPVSRLLISGGACMTFGVERFLATTLQSFVLDQSSTSPSSTSSSPTDAVAETVALLYEAHGNREVIRRMLRTCGITPVKSTQSDTPLSTLAFLFDSINNCDSLMQLSRLTIRRQVAPRVLWAVQHLQLPDALKRFITIE